MPSGQASRMCRGVLSSPLPQSKKQEPRVGRFCSAIRSSVSCRSSIGPLLRPTARTHPRPRLGPLRAGKSVRFVAKYTTLTASPLRRSAVAHTAPNGRHDHRSAALGDCGAQERKEWHDARRRGPSGPPRSSSRNVRRRPGTLDARRGRRKASHRRGGRRPSRAGAEAARARFAARQGPGRVARRRRSQVARWRRTRPCCLAHRYRRLRPRRAQGRGPFLQERVLVGVRDVFRSPAGLCAQNSLE